MTNHRLENSGSSMTIHRFVAVRVTADRLSALRCDASATDDILRSTGKEMPSPRPSRTIWFSVVAVFAIAPVTSQAVSAPKTSEQIISDASALQDRATQLYVEGRINDSVSIAEQACAMLEVELGDRSLLLAGCLNQQAEYYMAQGRHQDAEPLLDQALRIQEDALPSDHPDIALTLNILGLLYQSQGRYSEAEPLHLRALSLNEGALPPRHPEIASSMNNLAISRVQQGNHDGVERLFKESIAIFEDSIGKDHPKVANALNNLSRHHEIVGDYEEATRALERAHSIYEKYLGDEHLYVAVSASNLGKMMSVRQEYEKAEALLRQANSILESVSPGHPAIASNLASISLLYYQQGNYDQARSILKRSLAMYQESLGSSHPYTANCVCALGLLESELGKYGEAEKLLRSAISVLEAESGPSGFHAICLNNLALNHYRAGRYGDAELIYRKALSAYEGELIADHPNLAKTMNNLGASLQAQGRFGEAVELHERALGTYERVFGGEDPEVARTLFYLGGALVDSSDLSPALEFYARALEIEEGSLVQTLAVADESRRLAYASTLSQSTQEVLSLHLRATKEDGGAADLALTTLLRRKGRVQDLVAQTYENVLRSLPAEHENVLEELSDVRTKYATLAQRGPGELTVEEFTARLKALESRQDELWLKLAEYSPVARATAIPTTISDVQSALPPNSVLLEFVRYQPLHDSNGRHDFEGREAPRYAVYLVFGDRFEALDLGLASEIDALVEEFRDAMIQKRAIPTELYGAVMTPVLQRIEGDDQLVIAADGALSFIPFGALYDGQRYLIETHRVHYVTTGRDLLRSRSVTPDFDMAANVLAVANPAGANLPGTEQEVEFLAGLLPGTEVLLQEEATEENLRMREPPWMLHLATHGFFGTGRPGHELQLVMDERVRLGSQNKMSISSGRIDNPMLYSGLELAAAGEPDEDAIVVDDGRLTAYEISGWNLRGTELVVLSACETGLGQLHAGEGVLGLRRAFMVAGAQTQVMSLWKVSDGATARLMKAYYARLLAGEGRSQAMQEIQLEMLRSEERRHPHDWASFVVLGEWGPLSMKQRPGTLPQGQQAARGCRRASVGEAPSASLLLLLGLFIIRRRRTQ